MMSRAGAVVCALAVAVAAYWALANEPPAAMVKERAMNKVIHLKATLGCKPDAAYAHFVDPALLTAWLTEAAEVEAKVGGKYELFWEPDQRQHNSTLGCRVTAVEPNQLIAFEWKSPKQFADFANTADPLTHVVVAFIPAGEHTIVHLTHSGWRSSAQWEEARVWQEQAWRGAMAALEKKIAGN
jgi:uncharacterized protein YndB with AHSA1/START domain